MRQWSHWRNSNKLVDSHHFFLCRSPQSAGRQYWCWYWVSEGQRVTSSSQLASDGNFPVVSSLWRSICVAHLLLFPATDWSMVLPLLRRYCSLVRLRAHKMLPSTHQSPIFRPLNNFFSRSSYCIAPSSLPYKQGKLSAYPLHYSLPAPLKRQLFSFSSFFYSC